MHDSTERSDILVSTLADDEDMIDLVEMFVDELPERASGMEKALAEKDFATLKMLAHQLKGAAGGYGFPTITDAARELELTSHAADDIEKMTAEVNELVDLCGRARANKPEA